MDLQCPHGFKAALRRPEAISVAILHYRISLEHYTLHLLWMWVLFIYELKTI